MGLVKDVSCKLNKAMTNETRHMCHEKYWRRKTDDDKVNNLINFLDCIWIK